MLRREAFFEEQLCRAAFDKMLTFSVQIIGDKEAERTTVYMSSKFQNYKALENIIKLPIKFIHVVRNPYDIIATKGLRSKGLRRKPNDLNEDKEVSNFFSLQLLHILFC